MKRNSKVCLGLALAAIVLAAVIVLLGINGEVAGEAGSRRAGTARPASVRHSSAGRDVPVASQPQEDASPSDADVEPEEAQTEEEKREAEEEKLVNDFDDLTDKWMEPASKGVTMADVDNFAKSFRKLPKARQDECIHRALNLVPDENVMLLAGILMDKSMDKEIVDTVYNDILNRDEDVKKQILQQIFKDKSHPCWADTAWILDVTGELPKSK